MLEIFEWIFCASLQLSSSFDFMAAPLMTYTKPLSTLQAAKLRTLLLQRGFEMTDKPYCMFAASGEKVNIAVYEKGPKVVVQGKGTEDFVKFILEPEVLGEASLGYEEVNSPEMFEPHIGVDESGKGDFFGPLVIAGVYVDRSMARQLIEAGAMDSKRISSDARINQVADAMRAVNGLVYEVISIGPAKYNELYAKFGNLNRLLAWGHARVIENLLARVPDCPRALSDQFANPLVLQRALQERGRGIVLQQKTKAESDPAVAAASIFARERFVKWLKETGEKLGFDLPKGASAAVKAAAKKVIDTRGMDALPLVAKMHFKTAAEAIQRIQANQ